QLNDLIDRHSYVAQYVSLARFTINVQSNLVFSSVIDLLFNVAAFIFVGAWTPFNKFQDAALGLRVWRVIAIAILVLLFRRLPVMMALDRWIPDVKDFREALFSREPKGTAFISTLALEIFHKAHKTEENSQNHEEVHRVAELIQPIVAFTVLCSITMHNLSRSPSHPPALADGGTVSVARGPDTRQPPYPRTSAGQVTCGKLTCELVSLAPSQI
ncbi:hypothetical protein FA15DRAFT_595631, partial [Coprinopsis marcescibilis]